MTDQPIPVKVVESPAEALRRLALVEDLPREDLWKAIAASVIDINERIDVVERNAAENRRVMASIDNRLRWPRPEMQRANQAVRARYPHAHACVTCSPDGRQPGPGCVNCRKTGMDQTPCQAEGHKPQCPQDCCDPPDTVTQAIDAHEASQVHDGGHERPDPRGTVGTG